MVSSFFHICETTTDEEFLNQLVTQHDIERNHPEHSFNSPEPFVQPKDNINAEKQIRYNHAQNPRNQNEGGKVQEARISL